MALGRLVVWSSQNVSRFLRGDVSPAQGTSVVPESKTSLGIDHKTSLGIDHFGRRRFLRAASSQGLEPCRGGNNEPGPLLVSYTTIAALSALREPSASATSSTRIAAASTPPRASLFSRLATIPTARTSPATAHTTSASSSRMPAHSPSAAPSTMGVRGQYLREVRWVCKG